MHAIETLDRIVITVTIHNDAQITAWIPLNRLLNRPQSILCKEIYTYIYIYMSNRFHNITVIRILKSFFFLFSFSLFWDWFFFTAEKKKCLINSALRNSLYHPIYFFSIDVALLSVLPAALWHIWMSVLMKSHWFVCCVWCFVFFCRRLSHHFCHFCRNFDEITIGMLIRYSIGSIQWIHTFNCIENANRSNRRHKDDLMLFMVNVSCCFCCCCFFFFLSF